MGSVFTNICCLVWRVREPKHIICITVNQMEITQCVIHSAYCCGFFLFCFTDDVSWRPVTITTIVSCKTHVLKSVRHHLDKSFKWPDSNAPWWSFAPLPDMSHEKSSTTRFQGLGTLQIMGPILATWTPPKLRASPVLASTVMHGCSCVGAFETGKSFYQL